MKATLRAGALVVVRQYEKVTVAHFIYGAVAGQREMPGSGSITYRTGLTLIW